MEDQKGNRERIEKRAVDMRLLEAISCEMRLRGGKLDVHRRARTSKSRPMR